MRPIIPGSIKVISENIYTLVINCILIRFSLIYSAYKDSTLFPTDIIAANLYLKLGKNTFII
jgi:hypothetical protein